MTEWTEQEKYNRVKETAHQHWSYVESLILKHQPKISQEVLEQIKLHYTTAAIHFYGHGWEDAKNE